MNNIERSLEYQQGFQRGFIEGRQQGLELLAKQAALEVPTIEIEISGNDVIKTFAEVRAKYQKTVHGIQRLITRTRLNGLSILTLAAVEGVIEKEFGLAQEEPLPFTDIEDDGENDIFCPACEKWLTLEEAEAKKCDECGKEWRE